MSPYKFFPFAFVFCLAAFLVACAPTSQEHPPAVTGLATLPMAEEPTVTPTSLPTVTPLPTATAPAVSCPAAPLNLPVPPRTTPLKITYLFEDNIWLWQESEGQSQALTDSGDVKNLVISPNGREIVFWRHENPENNSFSLWGIQSDGLNLRQFISSEQILALAMEDPQVSRRWAHAPAGSETIGQLPSAAIRFQGWLPDSSGILFNIYPGNYGMVPVNDEQYAELRLLDITSGQSSLILPYGSGGLASISPNKQEMLIYTADRAQLFTLNGELQTDYGPIAAGQIAGDGQSIAVPQWHMDGQTFAWPMPQPDSWDNIIWYFSGDNNPAVEKITVGYWPNFTPDLSQVAYVGQDASAYELRLADLNGEWDVLYANNAHYLVHLGWSRTGAQFLYATGLPYNNGQSLWLGQLCEAPQRLESSPAGDIYRVDWLDGGRFLLVVKEPTTPQYGLYLGDTEGQFTLIFSGGTNPTFSFNQD